jgi:competence protein ComEC
MVARYKILILFTIVCALKVLSQCSSEECLGDISQDDMFFSQGRVGEFFNSIRAFSINTAHKFLPSPHSELLLGMTIGYDDLRMVPDFKEALRDTGTIHVVVVSGFNISLVFGLVIRALGSPYKLKNLILAQVVTLMYAVLSGFDPPVIRSWVMGSVVAWGRYYGRSVDAFQVLIFSGLVMIFIDSNYLFNLSFQLSFMATLGLIVSSGFYRGSSANSPNVSFVLLDDFVASLSAQLFVWPIISCYFGTFCLLGIVVNSLILWTVPVATVLGGLFLLIAAFSSTLSFILSFPLIILLDVFTVLVNVFHNIPYSSVPFKITTFWLCAYYIFLLVSLFVFRRRGKNVIR